MGKLWTFGDSCTESFTGFSPEYVNWKGYIPKVYGEIISEKLGLMLENFGKSGISNYQIFQNVCDNIEKINHEDIIIISWTQIHRFRLVNDENEWQLFYNSEKEILRSLKKCKYISNNTIDEIIFNRMVHENKYSEEIRSWEKIIRTSFAKNNMVFWSPFNDAIYGSLWLKLETIKIETKNIIVDPHFSEYGQIQLSNILLERLGMISDKTII